MEATSELLRSQTNWRNLSALVVVGLITWYTFARIKRSRAGAPLPPGPKGYPIIGNAFDVPLLEPWKVYKEWRKQYGDIIYMEVLGQGIVVLNSLSAVQEVLGKRAANYSDRSESAVRDMMGIGWAFALMRYGNKWRDRRRIFHQFMDPRHIPNYHPIVQQETNRFLNVLLDKPETFHEQTGLLFGAIIMRISYGMDDIDAIKKLVHTADLVINKFFHYGAPGRLLVSTFPSLRNIPSWLPGAGWKQILEHYGRISYSVIQGPYDDAKSRVKSGTNDPDGFSSIARTLIEQLPDESDPRYPQEDLLARDISAQSYIAGSDTTISSALALFLVLALHPEVQRKAQEEIETVTGGQRLPIPADREHLPYIQAMIKEISRWHTVLPLCVPHVSEKEDVYEGYLIPAGSIILPNTWGILHDPEHFDEPMKFKPERYLTKDGEPNPDVLDPEATAFGYGRRICPGRFLSNDALTLMAASVLAIFDIKPGKDENGNPVTLNIEADFSRILLMPYPFKVDFVPRSPQHVALLRP